MDEQRVKAYEELVQVLLSCPSGDELEVLEQHQALLDEGLSQVMAKVANILQQQGQEDQASWLRRVVALVDQVIEERMRSLGVDISSDLQSILQVLSQPSDLQDAVQRVALCQQALSLVSRQVNEQLWAMLQGELGNTFHNLQGNWAENIEEAIKAYRQSLKVMTREAMPVEWAMSMMNLATAYCDRIRGERAENIEYAIKAHQASLEVRTREAMPVDWAISMMNLANAYSDRIRGDRAENIEYAIKAYFQSLQVMTREANPFEWATSMNNLATAYRKRILGDRAENIEEAIKAYEQSFAVRTREAMPVEWAMSMHNLANAYSDRIRGDRAENIEEAIKAHQASLAVRTCEAMPVDWAISKNNLANAYSDRIRGDRAENIEEAIKAYRQSLQVRTREAMPVDWAASMMNLATAYRYRIRGDRAENIETAIKTYQQSLQETLLSNNPNDCRQTARLLASLYADEHRWDEAQMTYKTALTAVEIIYQAALSKGSQEAELFETNDLYRRATYAYAKVGNFTKAITTLEQGRARGLSDTLQRDRADLATIREINPTLVECYQTAVNATNQFESTERRLNTNSQSPQYSQEDFRQQAIQARQSLKDCCTKIRQIPGYENFLALPTFEDVAATVQPDHPLVYLLSTPNGSLALILTTVGISPLWLSDLTEPQLQDTLAKNWFKTYSESRTNRPAWFKAIDDVTHQLWNWMMAPLVSHLQQNNLSKAILIPTGYLSYLPLHAAWTPDPTQPNGRRYALDDIQFTYAPNALSLKAARTVANQTSVTTLLAINEPSPVKAGHLPSSGAESEKAISSFPGKGNGTLLQQENATRNAVLEKLPHKNVVHFVCHGAADFGTPLNSGLLMANDEILSLRDFLDLKLQGLRLAILSACETGIPGTQLPDEVISLPTGLLQAGAAGVVSSLWSVADLSTMLLLSRFYDLWRTENLNPPEALRQAQIWLRDSNDQSFTAYHRDIVFALEEDQHQCPFSHPFHWAAFTYMGV